jgi:hypothetical protein
VALTTATLGLAHAADGNVAPGATVQSAKAEVSYRDTSKLSEVSSNPGDRTDWLDTLSRYVATSADKSLPPGERLVVRIDDVQLAGMYMPGRRVGWDQIRVVRDTTPPRIDLNFRLESAQGDVLKQGDRKLRNLNFLYTNSLRHQGDTLSYEKNLIDDWMAKEFAAPQ